MSNTTTIIPSKYGGKLITIYFYRQKETNKEWVSYPNLPKKIIELNNLELVETKTFNNE